MAVTLAQLQVKGAGFCNNAYSADFSGTETIVPAVASKSHYVTSITINCVAAITITIQDNTGTPVVILGPVNFAATSGSPHTVNFLKPVKVAAGKQVDCVGSGAGAACVTIQGYTE